MITTLSAKVLGQRIRQLRIRRGLTQQDLAGDDYSKSYISAIEQGKTRPSLGALQRIAAKLEVSAGALLDPEAQGFGPFDPNALPKRVRRRRGMRLGPGGFVSPAYTEFQLAQAELLIALGSSAQALEMLRPMMPAEGEQAQRPMEAAQVLRVYHLAAKATLHQEDLTEAFDYLRRGIQIAEQLGDREELLRLRNLLGVAYYRSGQVLSALEEHRACLQALVRSDSVQDPNLKLSVYNNIARDYTALHDDDRAMATYTDALQLLEEVNSLERQANSFKALATVYSNADDYSTASRYATKAAGLYQALINMQQVVRMENSYADLLIRAGKIDQAQQYLTLALELAEDLSSDLDRALLLTSLAYLSMEHNNLTDAQERIEQAVQISRQVVQNIEATGSTGNGNGAGMARYRYGYSRSEARQILAHALSTAGEVAAKQGDDRKTDSLFEEAIKILDTLESSEVSSDIYQRYARLLADRGQHERAAAYFERAYRAVTRRT